MTTQTAQRQAPKAKPKQTFKFRLCHGMHVQPAKKKPELRQGIGQNIEEMEVFWPGDVFETDIDLRRLDKNNTGQLLKKYEIVHPSTPLYRKKKGDDRPMSEVWSADLETTKAPGETFDAFVERMKNLQKIKREKEQEDPDFVPDAYSEEEKEEVGEEESHTVKMTTATSGFPELAAQSGDRLRATEQSDRPLAQFNSEAPFPPRIDANSPDGEQSPSDALYPPRPPFPQSNQERHRMLTDMSNKELWNLAKELKVNLGQARKHDDMVSVLMAATDPGEQED